MDINEDSFIGTWKGGPEHGLSAFTVDLKKENGNVTGAWIIDGLAGNEMNRAMEIAISDATLRGNKILFKPNNNAPQKMALEIINENEALFGPVFDEEETNRYWDQNFDTIAEAYKNRFGIDLDRGMLNLKSPEFTQSLKSHTVKLVRQSASN